MSWGCVTDEMYAVIAPYVRHRLVWDLGAGDLHHSCALQRLGAQVVAIDKHELPYSSEILTLKAYFHDIAENLSSPPDVAFVSWPANHLTHGLREIVQAAPWCVYIGLNCRRRGTACGGPGFWKTVVQRPLLESFEHERNNLLIYGPGNRITRDLHPEEQEAVRLWL